MKKIFYIAMACLTVGLFASCTQYNFDDTGFANGKHETTMWDYFKGDKYNWELLCEMAERADLIPLFQGTSQYGKNFTFFGPTSHSIRRYLYTNGMEKVSDIPVSDCRTFILNCVLPGRRVMLDDFKEGVKSSDPSTPVGKGGEMVQMASGKQLWIYTFHECYNNVPGAGPLRIHLVSPATTQTTDVASCNIETLTGIVHSLDYNFNLTDF